MGTYKRNYLNNMFFYRLRLDYLWRRFDAYSITEKQMAELLELLREPEMKRVFTKILIRRHSSESDYQFSEMNKKLSIGALILYHKGK